MPSLNKVMLIGHLGKNPEMSYTPGGKGVTKFSLATNRTWKNANGEEQKRTDWHNIEVWGRLAEVCNQYLHKGQQVYIEGRLQTDQYEQDGQKKYYTKVVANVMQMLGSKGNGQGQGHAPEMDEEDFPEADAFIPEDDIPF